jgi:hypothetical protein
MLHEITQQILVIAAFLALVVAGALAGLVLMARSVPRWFEDRDS